MSRRLGTELQAAVAEYEGKNTRQDWQGSSGYSSSRGDFLHHTLAQRRAAAKTKTGRSRRCTEGLGLGNEWGTIHGKEALGVLWASVAGEDWGRQ